MANSPLIDSSGVVSFSITCDGMTMPDDLQIVSIETNHGVNRIPSAIITIRDGDMPSASFPVADAGHFKPGAEIVISAGYDNTVRVIFTGVVIKHAVKIDGDNYARLVIECRDKALAMTVGRKNANYIDKKDSEVISSLIGRYRGLSASVDATAVTYKALVQYHATDWDYMMARAEVNGLLAIIDAGKVSVQAPRIDASPVLTLTYGHDLIEFEAELDARWQVNSVTSTSWNPATLAVEQETALPVTLTKQGDITGKTLAEVLNVGSFGLQTAAPLERATLSAWSKAQQTKAALSRICGRMKFQGNASAKPGVVLELKAVGKHFNGNVIATHVCHRIVDGDWFTEVEFGMPGYGFTEAHAVQAPEAAGITAAISGLHIGIVSKLDADPEGQYKVQVEMPLMNAAIVGVWARLANFYGSSGFGAFVIPEIGDEVVLGFFNNDPSCPVILGSLYSSKHAPPYELKPENNFKALVTRSKLKMEFDDGNKTITLVTPANNKVVINDRDQSILLQDQNDNTVELSPSGIRLDSAKDIAIKARGNVTISATQNVEITAQMNVETTGLNIHSTANMNLVAKAGASAELSATGQTTVKGAMVMIN
jgi:Rhs element Vgr protein